MYFEAGNSFPLAQNNVELTERNSAYEPSSARLQLSVESRISLLAGIECKVQKKNVLVSSAKKACQSTTAHMREAEKAWLAVITSPLSKRHRKQLLGLIPHTVAPWFLRVELLMDFLTDSFNVGGSTSLMALSGLFHLMREKNLDYPQFYQKLYSHLDLYTLHSKHRSRFFRLLDSFLSSTHLPAALVASFIKRLARLCLYSPPSGIVAIVPWIYNLVMGHPMCSFMIHRSATSSNNDPFRAEEDDPMKTYAVESSLWEIETLQSHYHPNVAAIARTISEQFTKRAYNLEDFLNHSYASVSF